VPSQLDKRNEVMDATASHKKLRCFFNPPDPVPLDEGLNRTAAYVLAHGRFHPTGFEKIEIWDKMPKASEPNPSPLTLNIDRDLGSDAKGELT
jgi:hypothetical protein